MSDPLRTLAWWASALSLVLLAWGDVSSLDLDLDLDSAAAPTSGGSGGKGGGGGSGVVVDIPFLAGVGVLLWASPLAHVAGVPVDEGRSVMVRPLQGGALCAVMQTFAWCTYALAAYLAVGALLVPDSVLRLRGLKTAIGILGFASQALVNLSLDAFVPPKPNSNAPTPKRKASNPLPKAVRAAVVSGLALVMCGLGVAMLAEAKVLVDPGMTWTPLLSALALAYVLEMYVARSLAGIPVLPGSWDEVWAEPSRYAQLVSGVLVLCTMWIGARGVLTPQFRTTPLASLMMTIVGAMAVGLGAMFVSLHVPPRDALPPTHVLKHSPPPRPLSLFSVCSVACVVMLVSHLSPQASPHVGTIPLPMHLALPVLAHLSSWIEEPTYALVAPFQGGPGFVALQGLGWMFYGLAAGGWLIWMVSSPSDLEFLGFDKDNAIALELAVVPMLSLSCLCLLVSRFFLMRDAQPAPPPSTHGDAVTIDPLLPARAPVFKAPGSPFPRRRKITATLMNVVDATVATSKNTMQVLALSVSVLSVALVGVNAPETILVSLTLLLGNAIVLGANYFRPFHAEPSIVVQEALGWTMFAVATFGQVVLFPRETNVGAGLWGWRVFVALAQAGGLHAIESVVRHQAMVDLLAAAAEATSAAPAPSTPPSLAEDLRELDHLLLVAKRPRVVNALTWLRSTNLAMVAGIPQQQQEQQQQQQHQRLSTTAVASGVASIIASHLGLFSALLSEYAVAHPSFPYHGNAPHYVMFSIALCLISCVLTHGVCGPNLYPGGYRRFQPFRGGPHLVVFQAVGWTLALVSCVGQVCVLSHGVERTLPGIGSGVGVVSWVGQICLLYSLKSFQPESTDMRFAFGMDRGGGMFLSVSALILLGSVDVAIVLFGLGTDSNVLTPLLVIGWMAVCVAVPFSEFLHGAAEATEEEEDSMNRLVRFVGFAAWTFSILLGLLLLGHASSSPMSMLPSFLSTKTGLVGVVAHVLTGESARSVFVMQRVVTLLAAGWFFWLFMPALRWFLDAPMYWYAFTFKTWKWTLSPDAKHPLENVTVVRDISYGSDVLDVIVPVSMTIGSEPATLAAAAPICWTHGGGHLFCKRELMIHQVTPFARAGTMVVAIEYPLSPDKQFPEAVVCVLEALQWCRKELCRGGGCYRDETPQRCEACGGPMSLDEAAQARMTRRPPPANPCLCCPHRRGHPTVQLMGDSAGGNLAAMVAALLTNEHLLHRVGRFSGRGDFDSWVFPRVQRLSLIYGLLGRDTLPSSSSAAAGVAEEPEEPTSWVSHAMSLGGQVIVDFCLGQYAGVNTPAELRNAVVLNDLRGELRDFPPETLMVCGLSDPLIKTNRDALRLIRESTGREVRLVEYPGATHAFVGIPPQWTFGRWLRDAFPATQELVRFHTGVHLPEPAPESLPRDFSPLLVFGGIGAAVSVVGWAAWMGGTWVYGFL